MNGARERAERHLKGWPVGLALVVSAVLSAALVVPRAVPPVDLPLPRVDREEQRQLAQGERALRELMSPLPYEVRAVGELVRRFGARARAQPEHASTLRKQLREAFTSARSQHGARSLLALRALQAELFVQALRREPPRLAGAETLDDDERAERELGGELASPASHPSWYGAHGFVGSDAELGTLFRMRWNELCDVSREQPFAPTLNEWRVYYRFRLLHPEPAPGLDPATDDTALRIVSALGELDPDYPIDFARGVALYRQGEYEPAARAFAAHLELHPDGPWALRARNHLAACGAELSQ